MRLVDGDDALVDSQDDADIESGNGARSAGSEVSHGSIEHLFGASQVKAKIAFAAVAQFLWKMDAAVLAVGVRPKMEDRRPGDDMQARNHLVEGLAAVGLAGKHVHATWGSDDVFVPNDAAL